MEQKMPQAKPETQRSFLTIETEDGMSVTVPEDKMESWQKADHKAPLSKAEQRLKDAIVTSIYGKK